MIGYNSWDKGFLYEGGVIHQTIFSSGIGDTITIAVNTSLKCIYWYKNKIFIVKSEFI